MNYLDYVEDHFKQAYITGLHHWRYTWVWDFDTFKKAYISYSYAMRRIGEEPLNVTNSSWLYKYKEFKNIGMVD